MHENLFDFIEKLPNPIPANAIPFYDWCNWTLITLPEIGLNSCQDVQSCITCQFIWSKLNSPDNSIIVNWCWLSVNPAFVDQNIHASINNCTLSIWAVNVDICGILNEFEFTFFDWTNSLAVSNTDIINLVGLNGMRFFITPWNNLNVGLPTWATDRQVLTWDAITWEAYWNNNQCCAQTMSFDTNTNILCLSWTNCVDLSSINTDNQTLSLVGNVLTISNGNSVDLWPIDNQTLSLNITATDYVISIDNGNSISIPRPAIEDCSDVQACMAGTIAGLQAQITQLAADIAFLMGQI